MTRILALLAFVLFTSSMSQNAQAQVDQKVIQHALTIASVCPNNWTKQSCMSQVSEANQTLAVNYIVALENANRKAAADVVKEKCAASTASREQEFPANAVQSAYTECANAIYDVTTQTGIQPDQNNYQLLVAAVLCMGSDPKCAPLENQMRIVAGKN